MATMWKLMILMAGRVSWACSMNYCANGPGACDGTIEGPGSGPCMHGCHGRRAA